jgi:hypothetical protein
MQLLGSHVQVCFNFPKLFMFERSVQQSLLAAAVAEITTSSLKNLEITL